MPWLAGTVTQFWVKEVRNAGWQNYLRLFPDAKVLLTGRDPRGIYLSHADAWRRGMFRKKPHPTPEGVVAELNREFQMQLAIAQVIDHLKVRYEDLCTTAEVISEVRDFVRSLLRSVPKIGQFNVRHPLREAEARLHEGRITARRVERWRKTPEPELVRQGQQVFDWMPEYRDYWGYQ